MLRTVDVDDDIHSDRRWKPPTRLMWAVGTVSTHKRPRKTITFIYILPISHITTFMTNHERWVSTPMPKHFTDTENTGVPVVPMVKSPDDVATERSNRIDREEDVLSHRLDV